MLPVNIISIIGVILVAVLTGVYYAFVKREG